MICVNDPQAGPRILADTKSLVEDLSNRVRTQIASELSTLRDDVSQSKVAGSDVDKAYRKDMDEVIALIGDSKKRDKRRLAEKKKADSEFRSDLQKKLDQINSETDSLRAKALSTSEVVNGVASSVLDLEGKLQGMGATVEVGGAEVVTPSIQFRCGAL